MKNQSACLCFFELKNVDLEFLDADQAKNFISKHYGNKARCRNNFQFQMSPKDLAASLPYILKVCDDLRAKFETEMSYGANFAYVASEKGKVLWAKFAV